MNKCLFKLFEPLLGSTDEDKEILALAVKYGFPAGIITALLPADLKAIVLLSCLFLLAIIGPWFIVKAIYNN